MNSHFFLLDGQVIEVSLSRRRDGLIEDTRSGMVYTPAELERGSLFRDRQSAFLAQVAQVATAGNLSPYWTYTPKSR
jgi:hypothetical protein